MLQLIEMAMVALPGDVAVQRHRRSTTVIMGNLGYDRIWTVDVCVGQDSYREIILPDDDFAIYSWIVSADGGRSLLFSSDPLDFAVDVDHATGLARRVGISKELRRASQLGFVADIPSAVDYSGGLWILDAERFRAASVEENRDMLDTAWRELLEGFAVKKMGPGHDEVFVRAREYVANRIGWVDVDTGQRLLTAQDGTAHDISRSSDSLFVLYERTLVQRDGSAEKVVATCPEGEMLVAVDVVPFADGDILALVASTEDHDAGATAELRLYRLT